MITEDYVSFEVAKLLKEKGFNADTEHNMWYVVENFSTGCHWNSCTYKVGDITREYDEKCCIVMPTLQMAMKWLRVNYNIHIEPRYFPMPNIYRYVIIHSPTTIENIDSHPQYFNSYEEACEEAIKYCLEILI